ncbi:MAG TPA: helix-turn-helix domain-containing protein [Solirubrobacteraceae bacterium]|nr:helix-turn-helix domain-containing protein [Solirubrobacteraceae bacterium]
MSTVAGLATRERLLAAARELIEEGGYASASVAAIAERAGVASGTLYRHFTSKEDLFVEVFRSVCSHEERAMVAAAESLPAGAAAVERLEAVLTTFARRALQNRRLAWALLAEPVDQRVDAERLAYRERYASRVAAELTAAVAARDIPTQDVAFTAAALVGGCGEALVGPLSADEPSAQDVVGSLRTFVRRAIGAPA